MNTIHGQPFRLMLHVGVLFVLCALFAPAAHAAVVRGGETYLLESGTLLEDDLYFVGNTLTLRGTTTGDVLSAGSNAILEGVVEGDVLVASGRMNIGGVTRGDVRVAGGNVAVTGEVFEDVVVLAGNVLIVEGAHIHGDLLVYGDTLEVLGTIDGVVEAHVRSAEIKGRVGHGATLFIRESFSVRDDAVIGGDLIYSAPRKAFVSETVSISGDTTFTPREDGSPPGAIDGMRIMFGICVYAFGAYLLAWLFPRHTGIVVERAFRESGWLTLKGFILILALPLFALALCVTILGILPGVMLLLGGLATLALSTAFAGVFAGAMLAGWLKRGHERLYPAWASLGGVTLGVMAIVPVIGWLVRALLVCLAFGTLCILAYEYVWRMRKESHEEKSQSKVDNS